MKFGDIFTKQIKGMVMGMSSTPLIVNIFIVIYENEKILGKFDDCVSFLYQFIDNGFGTWTHHPDPAVNAANWARFEKVLGESRLQWTFSKCCTSTIFMDMKIEIEEG